MENKKILVYSNQKIAKFVGVVIAYDRFPI